MGRPSAWVGSGLARGGSSRVHDQRGGGAADAGQARALLDIRPVLADVLDPAGLNGHAAGAAVAGAASGIDLYVRLVGQLEERAALALPHDLAAGPGEGHLEPAERRKG